MEARRRCGTGRIYGMNAGAADFLPYYSELKFAGHMAVSLAAAFAGGFGMWLAALYFSAAGRFGFCDSFAVSLFCASAVWIIPAGLPIPPLWEKTGMAAFLALPVSEGESRAFCISAEPGSGRQYLMDQICAAQQTPLLLTEGGTFRNTPRNMNAGVLCVRLYDAFPCVRLDKEIREDLLEEFDANGFNVIAWTNVGWLSFYTKDPYKDLSTLREIKLASAGIDSPVLGETFRAAGLTVEDIQTSKILQSLKSSSGVRGFFAVHMYAYVTGFYKSINYALNTKMCPVMAGFVISNSSWNKIPEKYKPEMIAAVERIKQNLNDSLDESDAMYVSRMEKEGVTMINPTPEELAVWEGDFAEAVEAVNRKVPDAFDMDLFRKIKDLLERN